MLPANVKLGRLVNPSGQVIKDLGGMFFFFLVFFFFLSLLKSLLCVQRGLLFNVEFESSIVHSAVHLIWRHPAWIRSWALVAVSWQPNALF